MNKITQDQFLRLHNDDITVKEYKETIAKISIRFGYILEKISTFFHWYDYSNYTDDKDGSFEPERYRADGYISFVGDFRIEEPFDSDIPIRWLWEDFEKEVDEKTKQFKIEKEEKEKKSKELSMANKIKKEEIKKSIWNKLTKEELKYITFK